MPLPRRAASPGLAALIALALAALLPLRSAAVSDTPGLPDGFEKRWQGITSFYEAALQKAGIVGSSLMFVHGRPDRAQGLSRAIRTATRTAAVDEQTIYHWASITKTFTGVAIMQLRDRGLLSLDDPVVQLRARAAGRSTTRSATSSQVTIRHLMSHSAGFRAGTWPWGGDKPWHPFEPTRWEQLVAMLPYTELLFAPGTKYQLLEPRRRSFSAGSSSCCRATTTRSTSPRTSSCRSACSAASSTARRTTCAAHRSHSYYRRRRGLKEQRFDFDTRHHGVERRPQCAARRHGEVAGVPHR